MFGRKKKKYILCILMGFLVYRFLLTNKEDLSEIYDKLDQHAKERNNVNSKL